MPGGLSTEKVSHVVSLRGSSSSDVMLVIASGLQMQAEIPAARTHICQATCRENVTRRLCHAQEGGGAHTHIAAVP